MLKRCGLLASLALLAACAAQVTAPKAVKDAAAPPGPNEPVSFGPASDFKLEPIPAVPPLEVEDAPVDASDLDLLKAVKAARTLDRDAAADPKAKADAWGAVGARPEPNPFKPNAEKRGALWRDVASAKQRRTAEVDQLRAKLDKDRERLAALLGTADSARRTKLEDAFIAAYAPYETEISSWPAPKPTTVPAKPRKFISPLIAPNGIPTVMGQRVIVKADFGAHAQSFSVDTSEDLISTGVGAKPTFDLSGFYAGGQVAVNVADQSDLAIGIVAYGRYHVTTSLPENKFTSGTDEAATLSPPDADRTGAFAVGAGGRLAGNVTERIGMELGLTAGYAQFLPPATVPGCGPDEVPWDPTLRGFQGELFVGFEFYPLALLSFGVSGRVGFGHVQGEWCVPGKAIDPTTNTTPDQPLDVSADSFSVGAQGEIGFHF